MRIILILVLFISCTSLSKNNPECDDIRVFQEQKGIVIIEAENVEISEGWKLESKVEGFSGDGYLTWELPTNVSADGQGLLAYRFKIENEGTYTVKIRNYHACEDFTECNDIFLRMNDTEWRKNFNHTLVEWDWNSQQDINHVFSDASYDLEKGVHILYLSGRSQDFSIDKIAIFHSSIPESSYQEAEISTCSES